MTIFWHEDTSADNPTHDFHVHVNNQRICKGSGGANVTLNAKTRRQRGHFWP